MALTKIKDWNPTDKGRIAQVVVWGVRGTDGEAYVMDVNPANGAFPAEIVTGAAGIATEATLTDIKTLGIAGNINTAAILTTLTDGSFRVKYASAFPPVSGLGLVLVAGTWLQFIASTSANIVKFQYINESGYAIEIGTGGAGAEVSRAVIAESGEVELYIAAGTRVSLRCATSNTLPVFWFSAFN